MPARIYALAKELKIDSDLLKGRNVSIISSVDPKLEDGFDHLIIENQAYMLVAAYKINDQWSFGAGAIGCHAPSS